MRNWLRTKYDKLVHKAKLWIYKWCLLLLKKLRIYHTADIITQTNSKSGFWWNDRLLLRISRVDGNSYAVVYCVPGVSMGWATVDMNDLIAGTAELPLHDKRNIEAVIQQLKEQEDKNEFTAGVKAIGTLGLPRPTEPTERLYNSANQFNAIKQEIWMEYQAKLKAEEPRKDG